MKRKAKQKAAFWKCHDDCTCPCHGWDGSWWDHPHRDKRCKDARRYIIKEDADDPVRAYLEGIRMERDHLGMVARSQAVVGSSPMPSATRNTGVG